MPSTGSGDRNHLHQILVPLAGMLHNNAADQRSLRLAAKQMHRSQGSAGQTVEINILLVITAADHVKENDACCSHQTQIMHNVHAGSNHLQHMMHILTRALSLDTLEQHCHS
jgi:hypothetical protein